MKSKQPPKAPSASNSAPPPERPRRRRVVRWSIAGAVLAGLVALVVVATQRTPAVGTPLAQQTPGPASASDDGGRDALRRFSLRDVEGRKVTRPSGRRPGVLVFTASYCTPCIAQAPSLVAEMRKFGSRAEVLTVSIDPGDSSAALRDAFKPVIGNPAGYPLAWDPTGQVGPAFGVTALGTEIVYDRAGREVWRGVSSPASEVGAALRKAGAS